MYPKLSALDTALHLPEASHKKPKSWLEAGAKDVATLGTVQQGVTQSRGIAWLNQSAFSATCVAMAPTACAGILVPDKL
ncbi:hypothetical protein PoB_006515200 [Plakobranchus ocellatus]|uniref:Uncharacterized protein n=1 Tax=Plakobranchus ocellatus TaxID=259542 RepID=A0AAV4D3A3_9GAST|nr:hypothetical protein PoB_006515200 [Plakobranchus ocellatus]